MSLFKDELPRFNSKLRVLHGIPNFPRVDIYANEIPLAKDLPFSKITSYLNLPGGEYLIRIFSTESPEAPILEQEIQLVPNSLYTLCIVTRNDKADGFLLNDANSVGSSTVSFLRFINLSPNASLLTLSLSTNSNLFSEVEYLETTGYFPLTAGNYNFKIILGSTDLAYKYIRGLSLDNNKFYTIYVIGLINSTPPFGYIICEDGIM